MKTSAPPTFVQRRIWLLIAALCGFAIAALVLVFFKHSTAFPVGIVVGVAGIVFVWGNLSFWWLELRYPHINDGRGNFVSRAEQLGGTTATFSGSFFFVFVTATMFVTVACIRVALDG